MTNPLLTTKIHIPPTRADLVARPRLFKMLDQGLTLPLTLVTAPPGFGKTSLITAWLDQRSLTTAWYSLDEHDNDLVRFLTYLVSALEMVQMDVGRRALEGLSTRRRPSLESVMTLLSNDIAAIPRDFVLVLDDYHLIELPAIHEALTLLLDPAPPRMHLVIATRADPPLSLARLRARGQLAELRMADLRFSIDEAGEFLNERMSLNLTMDQVAALEARAEGWVVGLQLAALSMRGCQDVARFIHAFTGTHRFILDYLWEEVLQRQTPEIQTFLLQTSILDQMNAALANTLTGRDDSGQVLVQLEKDNLFVIPLDDERHWYRYHHLFADLLKNTLKQHRSEEQIHELHRRASQWYQVEGALDEAMLHTFARSQFEFARAASGKNWKLENFIQSGKEWITLWLSTVRYLPKCRR